MAGGKIWTDEEIKILTECYEQYLPLSEITNRLPNRAKSSICAKAQKLGLPNRYIRTNSVNYIAEYQDYDWCFERFITRGMTTDEISEESGYSKRTIEKWIYEKNKLDFQKDFKLNDQQKMLIVAGCLGDGHIMKQHPVYIESHAENQKDYLFWKFGLLKNMCNMKQPSYYPECVKYIDDKPCNCKPHYRFSTRKVDCLLEIRDMSRYNKIDYIDEFGFATHFFDDGHYSGINWEVCLAEWSEEEKRLYINKLSKLFGVKSHIYKNNIYLLLDKPSSDTMNRIILNNIPNDLDIVQYKIIEKRKING